MSKEKFAAAKFSEFVEVSELYRSPSGAIYKGRYKYDNKFYVLKEKKLSELGRARDVMNEVKLLQQLRHVNVVQCEGWFRDIDRGTLIIVLEYCEGGDLSQIIESRKKRQERFSEEEIWFIFKQICQGVCHLHQNGIIHRDIKALNIFYDPMLQKYKVGDLGVSRQVSEQTMLVQTFYGTPLYLSPELVENRAYNEKTDIWSLGVLLYELCALKPPFIAPTLMALAKLVVIGQYEPLHRSYSRSLHRCVAWMLTKDYLKRPSIIDVLDFIEEKVFDANRKGGHHFGSEYDSTHNHQVAVREDEEDNETVSDTASEDSVGVCVVPNTNEKNRLTRLTSSGGSFAQSRHDAVVNHSNHLSRPPSSGKAVVDDPTPLNRHSNVEEDVVRDSLEMVSRKDWALSVIQPTHLPSNPLVAEGRTSSAALLSPPTVKAESEQKQEEIQHLHHSFHREQPHQIRRKNHSRSKSRSRSRSRSRSPNRSRQVHRKKGGRVQSPDKKEKHHSQDDAADPTEDDDEEGDVLVLVSKARCVAKHRRESTRLRKLLQTRDFLFSSAIEETAEDEANNGNAPAAHQLQRQLEALRSDLKYLEQALSSDYLPYKVAKRLQIAASAKSAPQETEQRPTVGPNIEVEELPIYLQPGPRLLLQQRRLQRHQGKFGQPVEETGVRDLHAQKYVELKLPRSVDKCKDAGSVPLPSQPLQGNSERPEQDGPELSIEHHQHADKAHLFRLNVHFDRHAEVSTVAETRAILPEPKPIQVPSHKQPAHFDSQHYYSQLRKPLPGTDSVSVVNAPPPPSKRDLLAQRVKSRLANPMDSVETGFLLPSMKTPVSRPGTAPMMQGEVGKPSNCFPTDKDRFYSHVRHISDICSVMEKDPRFHRNEEHVDAVLHPDGAVGSAVHLVVPGNDESDVNLRLDEDVVGQRERPRTAAGRRRQTEDREAAARAGFVHPLGSMHADRLGDDIASFAAFGAANIDTEHRSQSRSQSRRGDRLVQRKQQLQYNLITGE